MAPPNTETTVSSAFVSSFAENEALLVKELKEPVDLKKLAREQGNYLVFPKTTYAELEDFEHHDPGHRADPKKASLYDNADKIFDVTPHIGTEVHGLQLSKLTDQQKDDLALLVAERGVVFFRDQDITVNQALEFGKHYGPLHIHNTTGHPPNYPHLHIVYFDTNTKLSGAVNFRSGDGWHSDVTYERQPPSLTLLKIDWLPEVGGDTMWASGYAAYDRLSPAMQKFLEGLEAVHSGFEQAEEARARGNIARRKHVETTHPIIRTHPVTGWKSLFVQVGFTRRIVGLSKRESDVILKFLFQHIEAGHDFQVRLRWTEDTVAVWDNRVTAHNAIFDYLDISPRHGFRVTPQGERPFYDPNSKSKAQDLAERKKKAAADAAAAADAEQK